MPFLVAIPGAVAALIGGGTAAAGAIYGATKQAGANKAATQAQSAATAQALAFEQQKYADLQGRLRPWIASGQSSTQRMNDLLHLPASGSPMWVAPKATLRAPTGEIQQVPADHVDHYLQHGAVRL